MVRMYMGSWAVEEDFTSWLGTEGNRIEDQKLECLRKRHMKGLIILSIKHADLCVSS